ncbi:hypothetical protein THRCLA_23209, partial [Thraustotheca clavata]
PRAIEGHKEVLPLFISHGANVHQETLINTTPLHLAAANGRKDVYKKTPLHYAAEEGHKDVVSLLLSHGANIHQEDARDVVSLVTSYGAMFCSAISNKHG